MDLIRQNIGRNVVRVGITQYPAGLGVLEAGELKPDLVDACANLRMGTALFAKAYRIVLEWYGNPTGEEAGRQVFENAIIAWQSGYFEGERCSERLMLVRPTPGRIDLVTLSLRRGLPKRQFLVRAIEANRSRSSTDEDPNKPSIRVDLSGIGAKMSVEQVQICMVSTAIIRLFALAKIDPTLYKDG